MIQIFPLMSFWRRFTFFYFTYSYLFRSIYEYIYLWICWYIFFNPFPALLVICIWKIGMHYFNIQSTTSFALQFISYIHIDCRIEGVAGIHTHTQIHSSFSESEQSQKLESWNWRMLSSQAYCCYQSKMCCCSLIKVHFTTTFLLLLWFFWLLNSNDTDWI